MNDVKRHSVEMSHLLTFSVMGNTITSAVCSAGMNGCSVFLSCNRDMRLRQNDYKTQSVKTEKSNEDEVSTPATSSEFMVLTRWASHLDFYAVRKMVVATFVQTLAYR